MNKKITCLLVTAALFISIFSGCNTNEHQPVTETTTDTTEITTIPLTEETTTTAVTTTAEPKYDPNDDYKLYARPDRVSGNISDITYLGGVCDNAFHIAVNTEIDTDRIKATLEVSPKLDYTVTKDESNGYRLLFTEDIPNNSVIKIRELDENGAVNRSWAFQTSSDLTVKSAYPSNDDDDVSLTEIIDMSFSAAVKPENIEDYIEINPPVKGRFSVQNKMVYFTHSDEKFKTSTTYTVTIKKGLESIGGNVLQEDYSFSFDTISQNHYDDDYFYAAYGFNETFLEGDPAVIEIYCSNNYKSKNIDLKLYRYNSANGYYSDLENRTSNRNFKPDLSGLSEIFSSNEKPLKGLNDWRPLNIMLPDNLTEGYYVAVMKVGDYEEYYYLQVNPVSVFTVQLGGEQSFFINDTKTGKAAQNAQVKIIHNGRTVSGTTDKDGLLRLNTGELSENDSNDAMLDITYNNSRFISAFDVYDTIEETPDSLYYAYLYTDRSAYLTTDTVNVWGVLRPKKKGVTLPENLDLRFGDEGEEIATSPVKINSDGTFRAQFSYESHTEDYTGISLYSDDTQIYRTSIVIEDYVKPDYIFNIELPEYAVMPQRNPVTGHITATFYDGTPAQKLTFTSDAMEYEPNPPITDENGEETIELLFGDRERWKMQWCYHRLQLSGIHNEYNRIDSDFCGFFRDVMLTYEYDKDTRTLSARTNIMDFDRLPEFFEDGTKDYEILRGEAYSTDVSVNIEYHWYEKVACGTYYNYLTKQEETLYDYNYYTKEIGSFKLTTKDGYGELRDLPLTETEGYYIFELEHKDTLGQITKDSFRVYAKDYVDYYDMMTKYKNYSLNAYPDEHSGASGYYDYYDSYFYYYSHNSFTENQSVPFQVKCNGKEVENGKVFFVTHQNSITDEKVYDATRFSYKTDAEDIPNFRYCGAYFDGKHVFPIPGGNLVFNHSARDISFEFTTDKEEYRPGDTVNITVKATDTKGKALSGTTVNLSVVDEAAFAIREHEAYILDTLYSMVYYPYARFYYSYIQHVLDNSTPGEMGGGDGESPAVRKDFKDTSYFDSQVTGPDGTTTFTFKIADNITTWRATVVGIKEYETGRLLAGDAKHPVVVTQPVFITPIMLSEYVEGDDIAVNANCQMLDPTEKITYNIKGEGVDMTVTAAPSHTANFGKLPVGEYTVRMTAEKDGNTDIIEKPLTVIDSALEVDIIRDFDLSEGIDINPLRYPVDLVFYNKEYIFCREILYSLSLLGYDRETDIKSGFVGKEKGYLSEDDFRDMLRYMTKDGIISPFTEADINDSAEFTAIICAALADYVAKPQLVAKYYSYLDDTELDKHITAVSYMALAALGEPVLEDIRYQLEITDSRYTLTEKLWLTAGLALCGDYEAAYKYYCEYAKEIYINDTDPEKIKACVKTGSSSSVLGSLTLDATKIALVTASILNLTEADYFARYILDESYGNEVLMVYLTYFVPDTDTDAIFTYSLDGKTNTVELDRYRGYYLSFGKEQLEKADFRVVSGSVLVQPEYDGQISELDGEETINVTKAYRGKFLPGEKITVTIKANAYSTIYDVIPSCGRYLESRGDTCYSRNGQRIKLYTDISGTATYSFRINTSGEFIVESAVATDYSYKTMEYCCGASEPTKITVESTDEAV